MLPVLAVAAKIIVEAFGLIASVVEVAFTSGNLITLIAMVVIALIILSLCVRYIPHNRVGVLEKLWSGNGSLSNGQIISLSGEAGYQAQLLRGGLHFGYWRWQFRIHKSRLVTIPQGEIGYVYARDGEPLSPSQTLGRVADCNDFQDALAFLNPGTDRPRGQRGRQRAILREGVYAINPALFVVITLSKVYALTQVQEPHERKAVSQWQEELQAVNGFQPVIISRRGALTETALAEGSVADDAIGIVTIHDGPSLASGELIAPPVGDQGRTEHDHNNFQDPEAFLASGGRRGRQYQTLTDGTYFH